MEKEQANVQDRATSPYSVLVLETFRNDAKPLQDQKNFQVARSPFHNFDPNSFVNVEVSSVLNEKTAVGPQTEESEEVSVKQSPKRPCIKTPTVLERNEHEVENTLSKGCYCLSRNCLADLDPDCIYTHRRNLSELSKAEQNMFLTGIVLNSLIISKSQKTKFYMRHSYKGKGVCKAAFLYLHYCTNEQLRSIIECVTANGIMPIVTRHNMVMEELLVTITKFFSEYIKEKNNVQNVDLTQIIALPLGTSKKGLYESYKTYVKKLPSSTKWCSYTTFRDIMRENLPNIMVCRFGGKSEVVNENTPPIIQEPKAGKSVTEKGVQTNFPIAIITCQDDAAELEEQNGVEFPSVLQNSNWMNAVTENIS